MSAAPSAYTACTAIAAAQTHGALELLNAGFRIEISGYDTRATLDRLVDARHRLLTRADALEREVSLLDKGEESWW